MSALRGSVLERTAAVERIDRNDGVGAKLRAVHKATWLRGLTQKTRLSRQPKRERKPGTSDNFTIP